LTAIIDTRKAGINRRFSAVLMRPTVNYRAIRSAAHPPKRDAR
jgi:hypothetical protein